MAISAQRLARITRGQIAFALLAAGIAGVLAWIGGDAVPIAAPAAPELAPRATTFAIASLLDRTPAGVLIWTTARTAGSRSLPTGVRQRLSPRAHVAVPPSGARSGKRR